MVTFGRFFPLIVAICASSAQVSIAPRGKPGPLTAAKGPELEERGSNIRVDATLVQVSVTVLDRLNRPVKGLEKEHFRLFEDGVEQAVTEFTNEDAPLSIGLAVDTSGSMQAKLQKSRQAAAEFFKGANPQDEFFLVEFADRPELVVTFTGDTGAIQNQLTSTQSKGKTALLDGVYMAMTEMKAAHEPRRAVLIISDGGDNNSRFTESEIKNAVREADVQIYGIGIVEPEESRARTPEEQAGPALLKELAGLTGGRSFNVENVAELPDIAAKIGVQLRNQYVLYYRPKNQTRDGKFRHVNVKLAPPRGLPAMKAFFRQGYYAPSQ